MSNKKSTLRVLKLGYALKKRRIDFDKLSGEIESRFKKLNISSKEALEAVKWARKR